jgi:hypothetical protein
MRDIEKLVNEERMSVYGHPSENFRNIWDLWQPILDSPIPGEQKVALCMIQVKVARLMSTPDHVDSWDDIAGYAKTGLMLLEEVDE